MIGLGVEGAKEFFFDRPAVTNAVDRGAKKALSKAGAFVRQRARSSIRKRKKTSAPGSPPSSHVGTLKRFLFFAYEPTRKSVVVGPAKTNQVFFQGDGRPVTGAVPGVLEHGGEISVLEVSKSGRWQRANLTSKRRLAGLPTRLRTARVAARPYMLPALRAESANFAALFRDSARKAA